MLAWAIHVGEYADNCKAEFLIECERVLGHWGQVFDLADRIGKEITPIKRRSPEIVICPQPNG